MAKQESTTAFSKLTEEDKQQAGVPANGPERPKNWHLSREEASAVTDKLSQVNHIHEQIAQLDGGGAVRVGDLLIQASGQPSSEEEARAAKSLRAAIKTSLRAQLTSLSHEVEEVMHSAGYPQPETADAPADQA